MIPQLFCRRMVVLTHTSRYIKDQVHVISAYKRAFRSPVLNIEVIK